MTRLRRASSPVVRTPSSRPSREIFTTLPLSCSDSPHGGLKYTGSAEDVAGMQFAIRENMKPIHALFLSALLACATDDASPTTNALPSDELDTSAVDIDLSEPSDSGDSADGLVDVGDLTSLPSPDGRAATDGHDDEVHDGDGLAPGGDAGPIGDVDSGADGSGDGDGGGVDADDSIGDDGSGDDSGGDGGTDCFPEPPPADAVLEIQVGVEVQGGPDAFGGWLAQIDLEPRIFRYTLVPDGFDARLILLRGGGCGYSGQYFDGGGSGVTETHEALTWPGPNYVLVEAADGGPVGPFSLLVEDECTKKCDERVCGPDGCGGSCGQCPEGLSCSGAGQCTEWLPYCTPGAMIGCGTNLLPQPTAGVASNTETTMAPCLYNFDTGLDAPEVTSRFVAPFDGTFALTVKSPYGGRARVYPAGASCAEAACLAAAQYGSFLEAPEIAMKAGEGFDIVLDSPSTDPLPWWYELLTPNSDSPQLDLACCEAACGTAECGPNGCGDTCGDCAVSEACVAGACIVAPAVCEPIDTVGCGEVITGTFPQEGEYSLFNTHACSNGTFPGPERVYRFVGPSGKAGEGWLEVDGASVFVYSGAAACSTMAKCVGYAASFGAVSPFYPGEGAEYFMVVDAVTSTPGGAFTFSVKCQ